MTGPATERPKRLIITEMVLENFKSYAGVQRIGPFHKVREKDVVTLVCRGKLVVFSL